MVAFVLNRHGRMVFPSNIIPELNFSTIESLEQVDEVIRRDVETKAPSGTDILDRIGTGAYDSRYALMPDMALNLFSAHRFAITMYEKWPTRWAAVGTPDLEYHTLDLPTEDHGGARPDRLHRRTRGRLKMASSCWPAGRRLPPTRPPLRRIDKSRAAGVARPENRARLDLLAARRLTDDLSHDHEGPAVTAVCPSCVSEGRLARWSNASQLWLV